MDFEHGLAHLWEAIIGKVERHFSDHKIDTFFTPSVLTGRRGRLLTIQAPNDEIQKALVDQFSGAIVAAAREVLGITVKIKFTVAPTSAEKPADYNLRRLHSPLIKSQQFDTFGVGSSNKLAYSAALHVCDEHGTDYNPLIIHGQNGCGKTHLLNAIANKMKANKLKVLSLPAEKFITNFVQASMGNQLREFRGTFDHLDCLLIDGLHFFEGKKKTCEFFVHIVNDFSLYGRQLVISSNKSIANQTLPPMLNSSLARGLEAEIFPPNLTTRRVIYDKIAQRRNFNLSLEMIEQFAGHSKLSITQYEGILNEVIARSRLTGEEASREMVNSILSSRMSIADKKPTVKQVLDVTAREMGVSVKEIVGKNSQRLIVKARRNAVYIMRHECDLQFAEIARELGNRKRQAINLDYGKAKSAIKQNKEDEKEMNQIMDILKN